MQLCSTFSFPTVMITQQHSLPNSDKSHQLRDFFSGGQVQQISVVIGKSLLSQTHEISSCTFLRQPSLMPMTQIFGTQVYPAAAGVTVQETNKPCMLYD